MEEMKDDNSYRSYDIELIINSISEDILIDNIYDEINNIKEVKVSKNKKTNYLQIILDKYNILKNTYSDQPEILADLEEVILDIVNNIKKHLEEVFEFSLEFDEMTTNEEIFDSVQSLYNVFVVNIEITVKDYLIGYIKNNIDELSTILKPKRNKNDIVLTDLKDNIDEKYIGILYQFELLIKHINSISNEDALELVYNTDEELFEYFYIHKLFFTDEISEIEFKEENNISDIFLNIIRNNYNEIFFHVRNYILKIN